MNPDQTNEVIMDDNGFTHSAKWRTNGEPDPHGSRYSGERAKLAMGNLSDDELANGAYLNYDKPLDIPGIMNGTSSSPIAWMTAVKDRIRWLSRKLEESETELKELKLAIDPVKPVDLIEAEFAGQMMQLVMSKIDQMHDACKSDNAEKVLSEFVNEFESIFIKYIDKRHPFEVQ